MFAICLTQCRNVASIEKASCGFMRSRLTFREMTLIPALRTRSSCGSQLTSPGRSGMQAWLSQHNVRFSKSPVRQK